MSAVLQEPVPELRPMRSEDVDAVMAIEEVVYPHPWTGGIFRDCIRVGYSCWVFMREERLIGYGVMSAGGGEAHVLNIAIAPEAQGRGLGRRMLEHLLELGRSKGASEMLLEVRPSNTVAVGLYESMGFRRVGRRKGYYPAENGSREDALVLARDL